VLSEAFIPGYDIEHSAFGLWVVHLLRACKRFIRAAAQALNVTQYLAVHLSPPSRMDGRLPEI
jgi:hypothetical protein